MSDDGDARLQARLQELFVEELDEQLDRLDSGLEILAESLPDVPEGTVAELFRAAHSLKGAAQAVNAAPIASACHYLEEALAKIRDGKSELDAAAAERLRRLADTVVQRRQELGSGVDPTQAGAESAAPAESTPPRAATVSATRAQAPALTKPAEGTSTAESGPGRVAGHKIDALVAQASDLITTSYGSEALVERLVNVGERLLQEERQRQRERAAALGHVTDPDERRRVSTMLDQADERSRESAMELDRILKHMSAHQKSLRSGASGFAEAARKARTVPFDQVTAGLARQVRELAQDLHKEVELDLTATDVEVERELVLTLREVLGHLVRNALDHGIESPADRVAAGKPRGGTIRVSASLRSDGIQVLVADDGRGVDEARLRSAAEARDLARPNGGELTIAEAMFAPGVSTAERVSSVSGRGVGLDAVRTTVEATGGTVTVSTEAGRGTTLKLVLPLNLSTIRALLVSTGEDLVAFPSASVRQLLRVSGSMPRLDGSAVMALDDEVVPLVRLNALLGWGDDGAGRTSAPTGLVVSSPAGAAVFAVDSVVTEREIVLRSSPPRLAGFRTVLGTAQLEDGATVLVLNPPACVRTAIYDRTERDPVPVGNVFGARSVLLAEDSLTTREIERSLLESAGFTVVVASDGQEAWDLLQTSEVDAVVSDVNMPRMDGISLCRAIRASKRLEGLPVVLVTSLHSQADRQAGLDAGADAYLTKAGFNRDELVAALERLL